MTPTSRYTDIIEQARARGVDLRFNEAADGVEIVLHGERVSVSLKVGSQARARQRAREMLASLSLA